MPRSALVAAAMSANTIHACSTEGMGVASTVELEHGLQAQAATPGGASQSPASSMAVTVRLTRAARKQAGASSKPNSSRSRHTGAAARTSTPPPHLAAQPVGAHGHDIDDLAKLAKQRVQQLLQLCSWRGRAATSSRLAWAGRHTNKRRRWRWRRRRPRRRLEGAARSRSRAPSLHGCLLANTAAPGARAGRWTRPGSRAGRTVLLDLLRQVVHVDRLVGRDVGHRGRRCGGSKAGGGRGRGDGRGGGAARYVWLLSLQCERRWAASSKGPGLHGAPASLARSRRSEAPPPRLPRPLGC